MKIVIDIPNEHYENLAKIANAGKEPLGYWERVVMCGTPLPKGHGDLIDRKELEMYGTWQLQIIPEGNGKCVETRIYSKRAVDAMPIIIPADKEVSE